MIRGPTPGGGFSSGGGGRGMSSSFGLTGGAADAVRLGKGGGRVTTSDRLQLRQAKRAPAAATKPMAAIAYFALPESGRPAGGRLEGGGFISEGGRGRVNLAAPAPVYRFCRRPGLRHRSDGPADASAR